MNITDKKHRILFIVNIALFGFIIAAGFLLSMFYPKETVSEIEQRSLAKFPAYSFNALFSGRYTQDISTYYTDVFPFRSTLVASGSFLDDLKGFRYDDVKIYTYDETKRTGITAAPETADNSPAPAETQNGASDNAPDDLPDETTDVTPGEAPDPEKTSDDFPSDETPDYIPQVNPYDALEGEWVGSVFVVGDTVFDTFGGNPIAGNRYAETVNNFAARLGGGINVFVLIAPTYVEFALPEKYKQSGESKSQKVQFDVIENALSGQVIWVNSYEAVERHALSEYCYFRTDHHWTQRGAYYAYEAFCKAAGLDIYTLDTYERSVADGYLGSFYSLTQDAKLRDNPDHIEMFAMPEEEAAQYTVTLYLESGGTYDGKLVNTANKTYVAFINGDAPHTKITGPNKNGRKLLVFKESYGNALIPFLARHYEEIHVGDIRYFKYNANTFIEENGITDVLFLNNIFFANTNSAITMIEEFTK